MRFPLARFFEPVRLILRLAIDDWLSGNAVVCGPINAFQGCGELYERELIARRSEAFHGAHEFIECRIQLLDRASFAAINRMLTKNRKTCRSVLADVDRFHTFSFARTMGR